MAVESARGGASEKTEPASTIAIRDLSRFFDGQVTALDGVDLDIRAGEFFTLLGPSGCGKTTLLRLLAGLDTPDSGEIRIGGRPMEQVPAHRRSVNTVFQSYALFPHRNVYQNIAFGLEMRRVDAAETRERVRAIAELIGIEDLLNRSVEQLSGGQKQRVALARALVNEPDVLLLDEPLSALDAGLRTRLQVELKRLQHRLGITFVFVTHDQEEAMVMSDRIAVLNNGRIAQVGTPRDIYESPRTLFVARFMGHENLLAITERDEVGVTTVLGRLEAALESGSHLLLRPEALRVLPADQNAGDHRFPARVEERLYRGPFTDYRLRCGDQILSVRASNHGQAQPSPGDSVWLEVLPEAAATLRDQDPMD